MREFIDLIPIEPLSVTEWSDVPLTEYQHVDVEWTGMPDYDGGHRLGSVSTKAGVADIMAKRVTGEMALWAIVDDEPIGFLGLREINGHVILANAYVEPRYARQGVISEMTNFVIRVMGIAVLSDTQVSDAGIALMTSMRRNFSTRVKYIPTGEVFDLDTIGKAETKDGQTVMDPADDYTSPDFYDPKTKTGQRFFFLYEGRETVNEDVRYGCDRRRHLATKGWVALPGYFSEGDL